MADIEKVKKGIKACLTECIFLKHYHCPYKTGRDDYKCVEQLREDVLELLKEQQEEIDRLKAEKTKAFDYLFSKFAGHSNYHGDSVLCAIEAVKEGKEIETVKTMDEDGECEKNCLTCQNSFSDEEDHLHCMAEGQNHEEIVADGYVCEQWS